MRGELVRWEVLAAAESDNYVDIDGIKFSLFEFLGYNSSTVDEYMRIDVLIPLWGESVRQIVLGGQRAPHNNVNKMVTIPWNTNEHILKKDVDLNGDGNFMKWDGLKWEEY